MSVLWEGSETWWFSGVVDCPIYYMLVCADSKTLVCDSITKSFTTENMGNSCSNYNSSPLAIVGWHFLLLKYFLLAGSVRNAYHTKYRASISDTTLS